MNLKYKQKLSLWGKRSKLIETFIIQNSVYVICYLQFKIEEQNSSK